MGQKKRRRACVALDATSGALLSMRRRVAASRRRGRDRIESLATVARARVPWPGIHSLISVDRA
jgi:hypothetical protein